MREINLDKDKVSELYSKEGLTSHEIAKQFGISVTPVLRICRELGIIRRDRIRNIREYIKKRILIDDNGCWQYQGKTHDRYVKLNYRSAHRVSYEAFKDRIPIGLTIDHLCRNKHCLNPEHLEVVTIQENISRGNGFCAINSRKTHCKRGHLLSGYNLCIYAGKRQCRTCLNKAQSERYHKRMVLKRQGENN